MELENQNYVIIIRKPMIKKILLKTQIRTIVLSAKKSKLGYFARN